MASSSSRIMDNMKFPPTPESKEAPSIETEFKEGDVLFGLLEPRNQAMEQLKKKGLKVEYARANDLNKHSVSYVIKESKEVKLKPEEMPHYEYLKKNREYLIFKPGKPIPLIQDDPVKSAAFRRACKLLLLNSSPNRTYRAHFITKGIDWKRVCDKDNSVTGSELRAAFRHYLENGNHKFISFYDENNRLLPYPPWLDSKNVAHFRDYCQARKKKQIAKSTDTHVRPKPKIK